jgi:hypothetical protein
MQLTVLVSGVGLQWPSIYDEAQLLEQLLSGAHLGSSGCDLNKNGRRGGL